MNGLVAFGEFAGVFLLTILTLGARQEIAAMRNRRCGWCGVALRWWQMHYCRRCSGALTDKYGFSPPCTSGARIKAKPDRWGWK